MLTSLRVRLILSHLAVIFVAMAASGFLLLSLMEQYLLQAVEDSLIAQGRIVAEVLIPNTNVGGPVVEGQASAYNAFQQNSLRTFSLQTQNVSVPPISTLSRDLTYLTDASLQLNSQLITRIRIVDAQGTVSVDTRGERGKSLLDDPLVAQGLQGIYAQAVGAGEGESDTAMYIVLPVTGQGEVIGTIYLSQSLRDTTAVLNDVRTRLLISAGIALLVSALVGLILSQAVSKPVRQLTATAEAIAQGKPLAEVASQKEAISKPSDEIGRLRISFFNMLARLQAANRTQTDFVANVSHELRTPLTSIKGLVETLCDGAKDDLAVRDKFLETVGGETDRLIRLVNDLLILSRADSQALTLNLEDVDLLELARAAAAELQPQADARRIVVIVNTLDHESPVRADPDRIKQVLVNLLANAIQYSHPNGEVMVSLNIRRLDGQVSLKVQDNGIGIPAEALSRVGQRFYRVDKARSRAQGGSGLGLAIARALLEAHGGNLQVESQEGKGTTVTATLPVM